MANETLERSLDEARDAEIVYQHPALILRARDQAGMHQKARTAAPDPVVFDEANPFYWTSEASSTRLDSYHTHMLPSTLRNFAADFQAGISFQNSHSTRELGFGRSFDGRFLGAGGSGVARTEGDFYTIPGLNLNGVPTDDLIRGIQTGLIADNSVGFYLGEDGRYLCDLCTGDLMECMHWPGMRYEVEGKREPQLATAGIDNAHVAELSAVYDGSTPGAGVTKAYRMSEAGLIEPQIARLLETQYRIKLPAAHHAWAGTDLRSRKEADMPDNDTRAPDAGAEWTLPAAERERYRTLVIECGLKPDAPPAAIVEALRSQIASHATERDTAVTERDTLQAKVSELEPRAKDGDAYRQSLVDSAWSLYVEAGLADGVDETEQRAYYAAKAIPALRKEIEEYTKLRTARFPGGRLTIEGEPPPPATPTRELPLAAYRV